MAKIEINTKTEVAVLKTEMQMIKEQNERDHSEIKKDICEVKDSLNAFIASADKKYASKTVEKVVYGGAGAILLAVLYYILNHVGIR